VDRINAPADPNVVYASTKFHAAAVSTACHSVPNCASEKTKESEGNEDALGNIPGAR
jgi:hypothetical protein